MNDGMTGPGGGCRGLLLLDWRAAYLHIMQFQPAIPTQGTTVPASISGTAFRSCREDISASASAIVSRAFFTAIRLDAVSGSASTWFRDGMGKSTGRT